MQAWGPTVAHWETCQDWSMRDWREKGRRQYHQGKDRELVGSNTFRGPA